MSTTVTPTALKPRAPRRWRDLRRSVKLCVLGFVGLLLFAGLEVASRVYWKAAKGVPPNHPDQIWRSFFRELNEAHIDAVAPFHGDDTYDVLLLGGSVFHYAFGDIGERLRVGLEQKLGRKVRVVNLASPGRITLDSRVKYEHLTDKRFDLVIVYEGINDIKLNNTPPGKFRPDYSHHPRYAQLNHLALSRQPRYLMLPFTAYYLATSLQDSLGLSARPGQEFNAHGREIKTPLTFETNLEAMAATAKQRGDRLLLLTFASHIPKDYTEEAFQAKQLDYVGYDYPASLWGEPETVAKALAMHNAATRRVAARHPEAMLLDTAALMPDDGVYFTDPCHLTKKGCERFVENVLANLDVEKLKKN